MVWKIWVRDRTQVCHRIAYLQWCIRQSGSLPSCPHQTYDVCRGEGYMSKQQLWTPSSRAYIGLHSLGAMQTWQPRPKKGPKINAAMRERERNITSLPAT